MACEGTPLSALVLFCTMYGIVAVWRSNAHESRECVVFSSECCDEG